MCRAAQDESGTGPAGLGPPVPVSVPGGSRALPGSGEPGSPGRARCEAGGGPGHRVSRAEGETTSQVMITRRDSHTSVAHPAPPAPRYKQEKLGHFNIRLSQLVIKAPGGQAGQGGLSM